MKNLIDKFIAMVQVSIKLNWSNYLLVCVILLFSYCSPSDQKKEIIQKKDSLPGTTFADSLLVAKKTISSDCNKLFAEAKKMDSTLLTATDINTDAANKAIKAFTDFAYFCSADSLCPIYLIKTAQVARSINNIPQAKIVLDKCVDDYPKSSHRPAALFLLAQLYDEAAYLNKEAEAKRLYEKIITEYPKSDWAKSAKGALNFIGKTDEQIMEELKKKK